MKTSDLYKLNKDELIYLISTIREETIKETVENISKDIKRLRYFLVLQELDKIKKDFLKKYELQLEELDLIMKVTENAKER